MHVMAEPGQSSSDITMLVDEIGSQSLEKKELSIPDDISSSTSSLERSGCKEKKTIKDEKEFLKQVILKYETSNETIDSPDASDEEKETNRQRILNAIMTRSRCIFSNWHRDPNLKGKFISPLADRSLLGEIPPINEQHWGATLFDFYSVKLLPESNNLTFSSGRRLAAWMKANGEDYAKNQLEFAENEEDPYLILPYEITGLIQDTDGWDQSMDDKKSWIREEENKDVVEKSEPKNEEREYWQVPQPWPPASPFDPLAYPKPWPDEPFTMSHPKLEKYIMHSRLPTILHVHDSENILRVVGRMNCDKTDVVRTYRLKTSTTNTARRTEDDQLAEAEEARRKAVYDAFIADPHSRNETPSGIIFSTDQEADDRKPGPAKPPIFVVLPFRPPIPPAREAHLYLSRSHYIGCGNHSYVYRAELELPRSTIMEDEICHECIKAEMYRALIEQDGPNGEHRDPKWDEKVGRYVVKTSGKPPRTLAMDNDDGETEYYLLQNGTPSTSTLEYEGPYRLIYSKIGYQCLERGPYCEHIATSPRGIHPLTAKVRVAAKLSIPYDLHLGREAEAYQGFPRDFFEHWSGFKLVKPLKVPTPAGPLVPQFYGYYVPDIVDPAESLADLQYLSPILLIEDCGKQIAPERLTLDDKNEVAALVHRFNAGGWIHGSIIERNILMQPGPLSDNPLKRLANSKARDGHSDFRLIDFGRAFEIKDRDVSERKSLVLKERRDLYRMMPLCGGHGLDM